MRKLQLTLLTAGFIGLTATGFAATDQSFADKAAQGRLGEVQAGQLAEQKATPQVKQLGQTLVQDHTQAKPGIETNRAAARHKAAAETL